MKKIIIDIDGVLNDYPKTQLNFYNDVYKPKTPVKTLKELKELLSYNAYKAMKALYRNSDYKHHCKPKLGAKQLLNFLKTHDYLIYIITARKLFSDNMLEKTICWLKENKLSYDYIYCSQKKDFTIFEKFGKIDVVIEDNCDNITKIKAINGNALYFVVTNTDNQQKDSSEYIRVDNLLQVMNKLEEVENESKYTN